MKYIVIIGATMALTIGGVLNLHLVLHDGGVKFVQKDHMSFEQTYVDARELNPITWLALPRPVREALGSQHAKKMGKDIDKGLEKVGEDLKKIFK
jgi:hypothetical protein